MGLFSSSRARRASRQTAVEAVAQNGTGTPEPAAATPRVVVNPKTLRDSLHQLYLMRPSRDAFAEEAIKIIAQGAGVKAAAIVGFEQRASKMRLLATAGLEREAIQVLSGDSSVNSWDIPLRCLRNRRINVIESAHENPFVPRPLIAISPRRLTIAALPFYQSSTPIGVLVLFSPTQRGFADGLLHTLSQALRVCALALSELPAASAAEGRKFAETPNPEQPNLLRGLAALKAELGRLTQALEESERQRASEVAERVTAQSFLQAARERSALLEQDLAALRAEQARLPQLEEQIQDVDAQLATAVAAADAARAQVAQLETTLAETAQRADSGAEMVAELTAARTDLQQQLDAALAATAERERAVVVLETRLSELAERSVQLDEVQSNAAAVEAARIGLAAELEQTRGELAATLATTRTTEAELHAATEALSEAHREAETLASRLAESGARIEELGAVHAELASLREQLDATLAERDTLRQQIEAMRATLAAAAQAQDVATQAWTARIAELESQQTRLRDELGQVHGQSGETVARLHSELQASEQERHALRERVESLAAAEAERLRLSGRVEELEHDVLAAQESNGALEGRIEELSQVSARLIAERRDLHTRIERLAAGGETLEQEKQAAITAAQQRVIEVEAQLNSLATALEAARASAVEELTNTRDNAERALQALRAERDALQQTIAQSQQELAARQQSGGELAAELARLQSERAALAAQVETASADLAALEAARVDAVARSAALDGELATLREQLRAQAAASLTAAEASQAALAERHAEEVAALTAQLDEARMVFDDQLSELRREQERLTRELAERDILLQSAEEGLTAIDLSDEDDQGEGSVLAIDRDYAPETDGADDHREEIVEEIERAIDEVVLFDEGDGSVELVRQLAEFGHRISSLVPEPESTAQLGVRTVACAAINLAVPTAWRTLRKMRNGSGIQRMPLIAYALAANAPKGFWLGPVDFAILPVEDSNVAAILNRMVPKVKRVIAMSNDIDVMGEVRTQLTTAGISTAVVLDGRQALDLVSTVRPEAAVLHLSPSCVDVFRAIAGLRSAEISREIPILFLLDNDAQPREEAFLTAGVRMLSGRGNMLPGALIDSLASALNPYRSA